MEFGYEINKAGTLKSGTLTSHVATLKLPEGIKRIGDGHSPIFSIGCKIDHLIIPEGVNKINKNAFSKLEVNRISFPNTLEEIKERAFEAAKGVTHIDFPDSLTTIESRAFYGIKTLNTVRLPQNINFRILSEGVFQATRLTGIEIPESVEIIESSAFSGCSFTNGPVFRKASNGESSIRKIGAGAFVGSGSTTKTIVIPSSVEKIENNVFEITNGTEELIFHNKGKGVCPTSFVGTYSKINNHENLKISFIDPETMLEEPVKKWNQQELDEFFRLPADVDNPKCLANADISGLKIKNKDLSFVAFINVNLNGCEFDTIKATNFGMLNCSADNVVFNKAIIKYAAMCKSSFFEAIFKGSQFQQNSFFYACDFSFAESTGTLFLKGTYFDDSDFRGMEYDVNVANRLKEIKDSTRRNIKI